MQSILVIHMYFGPFPKSFGFWLKSCEENADVDFLIVTDNEVELKSKNIKVYKCTLSEIKQRLEAIAGFPISLENPRKLCDYKPVFGLIMQEFVVGYDFWGYCDSDLVFGNIRRFITDEILSDYDYILGMGHFHIQRTNDSKFDEVWKSARGVGENAFWENDFDPTRFIELDNGPQWETIFKSPLNHIFDEFPYGVSSRYFQLYPNRVWTGYGKRGRCFDDVDPVPLYLRDLFNNYESYKQSHYCKLSHVFPFFNRISNEKEEFDDVVYLKKRGALYRIGKTADGRLIEQECLYAHFLHRKMHVEVTASEKYLIRANRFVKNEEITPEKMLKWRNDFRLKLEREWQKIMFQVRRSKTLWKKIKRKIKSFRS